MRNLTIAALFSALFILAFCGETATILHMSFFWQTIWVEGGLALVAIVIAFCVGLDYLPHCRFDAETLYITAGALFILLAGYFVLRLLPFEELRKIDRIVRDLFWQQMNHLTLGQLALIALLAGIGEELLFRGLIQLGLVSVFGWEHGAAILAASLVFGLAHAVTVAYFALAALISIYLGFLFVWTDNLVIPIAVHALYDFFVFLFVKATPGSGKIE